MNGFWRIPRIEHGLLLAWLTFAGLAAFGLFVAWQEGLIRLLVASDRSRISLLIMLLFAIGVAHAARRVVYVSSELRLLERVREALAATPGPLTVRGGRVLTAGGAELPAGVVSAYVADVLRSNGERPAREERPGPGLPEVYAGVIKGPHELGWFLTDVVLKLGLLGTIVGFILMLGSVAETTSLDANTMQKVLRQMSVGMGTALYTTLAGLVCSLLLAVQYQLLDRGADALIEQAVHLTEVEVLPHRAGT